MGNIFYCVLNNEGGVLISISQRRERKTSEIIDAAETVFFSEGFDKQQWKTLPQNLN
jgi:hypothetical protein